MFGNLLRPQKLDFIDNYNIAEGLIQMKLTKFQNMSKKLNIIFGYLSINYLQNKLDLPVKKIKKERKVDVLVISEINLTMHFWKASLKLEDLLFLFGKIGTNLVKVSCSLLGKIIRENSCLPEGLFL